jgi:hypothetical protein
MTLNDDLTACDPLSGHPRAGDLASLAGAAIGAALSGRSLDERRDVVLRRAVELGLSREEAATPFGNLLDVLTRTPVDDGERALARAAARRALVDDGQGGGGGLTRSVADLLSIPLLTKADAARLSAELRARDVAYVLAPAASPGAPLAGEFVRRPRGSLVSALLGLTGVSLAAHVGGVVARRALAYRAPAELAVTEDGSVRVRWRVELLGRTLRDRCVLVPREGLVRATREVRYPGLALYAALLALVLGSYVGVSAFADGVRAGSPSLLLTGLVVAAIGLALDFALTSVLPGSRGRCRVILIPRSGAALCLGDVDARAADATLALLARR